MNSVSIWAEGGFAPVFVLAGLLWGTAAFCLPGIAMFRSRDRKKGILCLVLGILGVVLFIPWAAAVVIAAGNGDFKDSRDSFLSKGIWKLAGAAFLVLAAYHLLIGISDYRRAAALSVEEFYSPVILLALTNVAVLLIVCLWIWIASFLKGRVFWGFQMAACGLLPRCSTGRLSPLVQLLFILWIFGGSIAIFSEVIRCSGRKTSGQERTVWRNDEPQAWAAGRIRCLAGQYGGMEIPMKDGETLCIGSDPNLAHLIVTEGRMAPLYAEITFQKQEGVYLLAHRQENPVYLNGTALPELYRLQPGDVISFAGPAVQSFRME